MTATVLPFVARPRPGSRGPAVVIAFAPRAGRPPVLESVLHALLALSNDKLGTVTRRADRVYVMTIHGAGTFPASEWDAQRKRG